MSFFSRLFKTKQPETLEQKIANLGSLDQQQLQDSVSGDQPEAFVQAVASRLQYCPTLIHLATDAASSAQTRTAARKRIGDLLDGKAVAVVTVSKDVPDQRLLLDICGYSSQTGIDLVEQIDDAALLVEIARTGSTTQIRQAAASKLHTRGDLEQLLKEAKNKDKAVFKIAKAKLDVFKEQKAAEAKQAQELAALCVQAEQLAKRNVDDVFMARQAQIEQAWALAVDNAPDALRQRFDAATLACQQKVDDIRRQEQAAAEQAAAVDAAKQDVRRVLYVWQELIAHLYAHPLDQSAQAKVVQVQEQQASAITQARQKGLQVNSEARRAEELRTAAQSLLAQLAEYGQVNKLVVELQESTAEAGLPIKQRLTHLLAFARYITDVERPPVIDAAKGAIDQWQQNVDQKAHQTKQQIKTVTDLLRRGDGAVTRGHMGRARAILRDLEETTSALEELPSHLAVKIEDYRASLQKLGDWHEFAVTPKKEALVKDMQALVGSSLPPQQVADKVHKLQENWKELCRGGQNQDEALWQEFHAASQAAYEPCKAYFERQNEQREQNAEKRQTLLDQLHEYRASYDWDNADWKEVEKTLRLAREAWQSYWPVPRKDGKSLQQKFDELMDELYGKLKAEQERNRLKKQAIAERAEKLNSHGDIQEAIESAKRLQAEWQSIGKCRRKDDQALWKQFRAHCDSIFEKRNQEHEALKGERDQAKAQATALLDKLEDVLALEGEQFFQAQPEVDSISDEFKNLGELPKGDSRILFERYNNVMELLQSKKQRERLAVTERQWQAVFSLADRLRQVELRHVRQETTEGELEAVADAITATDRWPGNSRAAIDGRVNRLPSLTLVDIAHSEQQLRTLCIRSEIITGAETPAEDKTARMQYQVELMQNDGLGQAHAVRGHDMQVLLEEWLSLSGCEDEHYQRLLGRFARCWNLRLV